MLAEPVAKPRKTLALVARELGVHPATVFRWGHVGIISDEVRILLMMTRVGGRWMVADADLAEFLDRLNAGRAEPAAPLVRTPSARRRAIEAADRELERIGI